MRSGVRRVTATRECPNCAMDVRADAPACPICKYEFQQRLKFPWKPVAVVLLVVILAGLAWQVMRMVGR